MPVTSSARFTLYVPLETNSGNPLTDLHEDVARALVNNFGGFTEIRARGAWQGQYVYSYEDVILYVVDVTESRDTPNACYRAEAKLRQLAKLVKEEAAQEAVYLTRQPIQVEVI